MLRGTKDHLAGCLPCRVYLVQIQTIIRLLGGAVPGGLT